MKDQYFGDIKDYRKYGLIRILQAETGLEVLITWMLTPDDGRRDGELRAYLDQPDQWQRFDPELHKRLQALLQVNSAPRVALIERSHLLGGAQYCSEAVPDHGDLQHTWAANLAERRHCQISCFLIPTTVSMFPLGPTAGSSRPICFLARDRPDLERRGVGFDLSALSPRETRDLHPAHGRRAAQAIIDYRLDAQSWRRS